MELVTMHNEMLAKQKQQMEDRELHRARWAVIGERLRDGGSSVGYVQTLLPNKFG